ncbi:MAG: tRNA pseudouridine(55) synthase TruB [Lachnospiraceae bacterium]|nr:tRNA pseudouridine(55) synthase TruB [Lachnospiraceae bacterium]
MNGVLNVCKEKGYTSHDVVARLRGITHQKKIGHTGTLDPDATGVLPVCFGNATKLCDFLTDQEKEYEAVMFLGKETDTYDASGVMLTNKGIDGITPEAAEEAILSFVPGYEQVPPMYSAKKVGGKKLYELAREGKEIERKPVYVGIPSITITRMELPRVIFTVRCEKGTYIRSLIHDIGQKLSCGAMMEELTRTSASGMHLADALCLSEIEELMQNGELEAHLLATDEALKAYPALTAIPAADRFLHNGNLFLLSDVMAPPSHIENGTQFRVYDSARCFVGLYSYEQNGKRFRPAKMFLS